MTWGIKMLCNVPLSLSFFVPFFLCHYFFLCSCLPPSLQCSLSRLICTVRFCSWLVPAWLSTFLCAPRLLSFLFYFFSSCLLSSPFHTKYAPLHTYRHANTYIPFWFHHHIQLTPGLFQLSFTSSYIIIMCLSTLSEPQSPDISGSFWTLAGLGWLYSECIVLYMGECKCVTVL